MSRWAKNACFFSQISPTDAAAASANTILNRQPQKSKKHPGVNLTSTGETGDRLGLSADYDETGVDLIFS